LPRTHPLLGVAASVVGLAVIWPNSASAQTAKTFIDYFQPTPITCAPTTNAWGCTATGSTPPNCVAGSGVVPRDTCNGIESPTNPPRFYYWDGKVIRAADGTWHLFADRWAGTAGFQAWTSSDPIHAVGDGGPLGPFSDDGFAYSDSAFGSDPHHGHNSSVVALADGTFALVVSEVVPFTIFTAARLDGPWVPCSGNPGAGLSVPSGFGGNTNYASNISLAAGPNDTFEIVQRHGLIATSGTGVCGPYKAQQPTNTYPSSEAVPAANAASIYPNRQKHLDPQGPSTVESTYVLAEDPVIWFSGGQYHVLYDYPDDRVGYLLTSTDGIHDWTDRGVAYDPRDAQQIFRYTDGTVDHWFKMERPGVVLENGHVTYVTFAVSDVDKNNQIGAGSDHGSKVIVVPFDGAQLDCDIGDAGCLGVSDAGGADAGNDAGLRDASFGEGGQASGSSAGGGSSSSTGRGASGSSASGGTASRGSTSGASSRGSGADSGLSDRTDAGAASGNERSGCGCLVGARASTGAPGAAGFFAAFGLWRWTRTRRRRQGPAQGREER
jgi:hypothetical protein